MAKEIHQALPKPERLVYSLYRGIWSSLDLLFPPTCGGCGKSGIRWCSDCNQKVITILPTCCPICGQKQKTMKVCSRCNFVRPAYNQLRSWAVFNNEIRNAVHRLKYRRDISLGDALSRPLIDIIQTLQWPIDIVVPVPLSNGRMKERGYNQAALIALPLALGLGFKYRPLALRRVRETESQVGLTIIERHANVSEAFLGDQRIVGGKNILLVDDVATSGATLNACADALNLANASEVYCITLARAEYN